MDTPICDYVNEYVACSPLRLHMPGHKGCGPLGFENRDITEITGADVLYHADGIISRSEKNAAALFGSKMTVYSCEGSSLSIRSMLYLTALYARSRNEKPLILAARNAHKVFITSAALLNISIEWMFPKQQNGIAACLFSAAELEARLAAMDMLPTAVYITSPDYLGNLADIRGLSEVCRRFGVLLLIDNAHGAYLRFLPESLHPLDLGADMCCDSAHKTLPVITGGAYLHISSDAPQFLCEHAHRAMALFASTSPSYLILQSLDAANALLSNDFSNKLLCACKQAEAMRAVLMAAGYELCSDEPVKLTIKPNSRGYTGTELAAKLEEHFIFCEYADRNNLVLMLPIHDEPRLADAADILAALPRREAAVPSIPALPVPKAVVSPHEVMFMPCTKISVEKSIGRIMAAPAVSCPPAIPVVSMGELISKEAVELMKYYSIDTVTVADI